MKEQQKQQAYQNVHQNYNDTINVQSKEKFKQSLNINLDQDLLCQQKVNQDKKKDKMSNFNQYFDCSINQQQKQDDLIDNHINPWETNKSSLNMTESFTFVQQEAQFVNVKQNKSKKKKNL
ncbi:hypothetical protein PPERSA_06656 [Pseudocohnilembus persalinus]|uniref:Uncharacterized protein n=1 Tax=Pseudocohnilembus persalinus TaxID=266149 RepID=A0A0V0QRS0_PSEPJ|nr:hypothetical protein PPERSA_06656 [Pseudocohnilembus persalinus]|eukprot:KRX05022.1 hypothetical protein PPERSA_06656 [Pseudocohnilembus persalinus]